MLNAQFESNTKTPIKLGARSICFGVIKHEGGAKLLITEAMTGPFSSLVPLSNRWYSTLVAPSKGKLDDGHHKQGDTMRASGRAAACAALDRARRHQESFRGIRSDLIGPVRTLGIRLESPPPPSSIHHHPASSSPILRFIDSLIHPSITNQYPSPELNYATSTSLRSSRPKKFPVRNRFTKKKP
ncbi:hypothetical protein O181_021054 [Austropuccinia psidii MF-1]|uniref:Uncharacterized protein n=1 Tax=Austropuccinia psidii MF-1 TaxID=1389203 RepID=A0A9Q3CCF8_9BASI|nr:hypothetical protein [Austropuccinia psidii MF-1]